MIMNPLVAGTTHVQQVGELVTGQPRGAAPPARLPPDTVMRVHRPAKAAFPSDLAHATRPGPQGAMEVD